MRKLWSVIISTVLLFTGCGAANFAVSLKLALAAGAPILDLLVRQGKISPAFKAGLVVDLSSEALAVSDMAGCFNAIPPADPASKLKHLQCVQALDQSPATHKLLTDFGSNPNVANIAADIDAIIQGAIIFYGGVAKNAARTAGSANQPATEAEIKARIKRLKVDLGQ